MNNLSLRIDSLARTVLELEGNVKDYIEAAVILEILGFSDRYAKKHGYKDIFHVSRDVMEVIDFYRLPVKTDYTGKKEQGSLRLFFSGLFYNVSWIIMLTALFLGGVSLWAAANLPPALATSIAVGVVLGFIVTGGIQQFFAWKIIYYSLQKNIPLARFIQSSSLKIGIGMTLGAAALVVLLGDYLPIPNLNLTLAASYLILVGLFRVTFIPIFAYRKVWALVFAVLASLITLFATYYFSLMNGVPRLEAILSAQSAGLFSASLFGLVYSAKLLVLDVKQKEIDVPPFYSRPSTPENVRPPKLRVLFYDGFAYFLYGSCYFAFLFADRLVSWRMGDLFAYNTQYHIGADIALLIIIPMTGVKFIYIHRLSQRLDNKLRLTFSVDKQALPRLLSSSYLKLMLAVIVTALCSVSAMYAVGPYIIASAQGTLVSLEVYRWSLVGYAFFGIFTTNAVFSFTLRRGQVSSLILLVGIILNCTLSSVIVGWLEPWHTVFGLVTAGLLIAILSTVHTMRLVRDADYVYYSAF